MNSIALEAVIIFLLILANGIFALSEMAVVSARKARLQQRVKEGDKKAQVALELADSPGRFLSTIQIGITLIGILAGALGGATIAEALAVELNRFELISPYGEAISIFVVVLVITYLSLIVGELVPKRLALNQPENVASKIAPAMKVLSKVVSPIVQFLNISTETALKLLKANTVSDQNVTEEEIKLMIEQGAKTGVFELSEQEMVNRVFRLSDRKVNSLMTPYTEVMWLDLDDSNDQLLKKLFTSDHSYYPLARGSLDNITGLVKARDLLAQKVDQVSKCLEEVARPALFVPERMAALEVLERFKEARSHVALVIDEYGGLQGLVTVNDLMEAIVGDIPLTEEEATPEIVMREEGSWLVDGKILIDELKEFFQVEDLPNEEADYQTLGGFIMAFLGCVPSVSDHFEWGGYRFEVVDMDGRRVDKVLIERRAHP